MIWKFQDEELRGSIVFDEGLARIEAFGHEDSQLLSSYEAASFAYTYEEGGLMTLINEETGVKLPYTILESSSDEILLSYLDEIVIQLSRRPN